MAVVAGGAVAPAKVWWGLQEGSSSVMKLGGRRRTDAGRALVEGKRAQYAAVSERAWARACKPAKRPGCTSLLGWDIGSSRWQALGSGAFVIAVAAIKYFAGQEKVRVGHWWSGWLSLAMGGTCWCAALMSLIPLLLAVFSAADVAISARTPVHGTRRVSPLTPRFCAIAAVAFFIICLVKVPELCNHALSEILPIGEDQPSISAATAPSRALWTQLAQPRKEQRASMWEGVERLGLAVDLKESDPSSTEQNASAVVSLGDAIEQDACILTCSRDSCPCDAFEGLPGHIVQSQGPQGTRGPPSRRDDSI